MSLKVQQSTPEPSVGKADAEIGTQEWADRVRLDLQALVSNVEFEADMVAKYFRKVFEFRAWTLMRKKAGGCFTTVEELCATPRPWGLGKPWRDIKPYVEAAMQKEGVDPSKALALETVPEPQKPNPTGKNQYNTSEEDDRNDCGKPQLPPRTAQQLRAINRADDAVKEAYKEGRISQTLAAKLGPKKKTPEQAAKLQEIANEIPRLKSRKEVDGFVRERLGESERTAVDRAIAIVRRMSPQELYEFEDRFNELLRKGRP